MYASAREEGSAGAPTPPARSSRWARRRPRAPATSGIPPLDAHALAEGLFLVYDLTEDETERRRAEALLGRAGTIPVPNGPVR